MRSTATRVWPLALLACLAVVSSTLAQEVFDPIEDLEFDAPEAWAMNYFASATLPAGRALDSDLERGGIDVGFEILHLPHLNQEQRTVGFGGFKEEDFNRSPAAARMFGRFGLGGGWRLEVGWAPPVEVDGVEADLWSVAVEKDLWRGARMGLGTRIHGQTGTIAGDLTCKAGEELSPAGSPGNLFACEAPSRDEMQLNSVGVELVASHELGRNGAGPALHGGISWNRLDTEFQVDALTFGIRDRSLLRSDGETLTVRAGASWRFSRSQLVTQVLWAPLQVRRLEGPSLGPAQSDDLVHVRLSWTRRLR